MTVVEKFPTSTSVVVAGWTDPEKAYAHDLDYVANGGTANAEQEYDGFAFAVPSNATLDIVEVRIHWYMQLDVNSAAHEGLIEIHLKIWDGSNWTDIGTGTVYAITDDTNNEPTVVQDACTYPEFEMVGIDISHILDTPAKINAAKVRLLAVETITPLAWQMYVDAISLLTAYTTPLTGNAQPSDVLKDKTFYNTDPAIKLTGTLIQSTGGTRIQQKHVPSPLLKPSLELAANLLEQKIAARGHAHLIKESE